ncbi:MAG: hypothetical protein ACX939_06870 [Hyphococcus sp.]
MTVLEKAVLDLAKALETLEQKVETRLDDTSADGEALASAKSRARAARNHATGASRTLAGAIDDLKALLQEDTNGKG